MADKKYYALAHFADTGQVVGKELACADGIDSAMRAAVAHFAGRIEKGWFGVAPGSVSFGIRLLYVDGRGDLQVQHGNGKGFYAPPLDG